jgi:hypothetical protein
MINRVCVLPPAANGSGMAGGEDLAVVGGEDPAVAGGVDPVVTGGEDPVELFLINPQAAATPAAAATADRTRNLRQSSTIEKY